MRPSHQNTIDRLRRDLVLIVEELSAQRTHGNYADAATGKALYVSRDHIADVIVDRLRRNWTVTERARPQRRVKPL